MMNTRICLWCTRRRRNRDLRTAIGCYGVFTGPGASGRMVRRTGRPMVYIPCGTDVRPMSLPLRRTSAREFLSPAATRCGYHRSRIRVSSLNGRVLSRSKWSPTPCRRRPASRVTRAFPVALIIL